MKRVAKDEKKAKKYDLMLVNILLPLIQSKKYDFLLGDLFALLDEGYSSHFLLGILSLIYLPLSDKIREMSHKHFIDFDYLPVNEEIIFDDSTLDGAIKMRINSWIEDTIDIVGLEYSNLQLARLGELFDTPVSKKNLIIFVAKIFQFFFSELNIRISPRTAGNYTTFIIDQIMHKIKEIPLEEV